MAKKVTETEKERMWKLYQKHGTYKKVAEIMHRNSSTVSRYVREYEAAVRAAGYVLNSVQKY
jgi:predicted transcriptional regulator